MEPIKFCHVIDGSNTNPLLYNWIKFSDRDKFDYTVVSLEPADGLQEQMRDLGVRTFSLDYTSRRQAVSAFWRLYRFFRREKVRIVQTHLFDASLIGLSAAVAARVPVRIFTGHHSHETPLHGRAALTFIDGLSPRTLSNHTIAPSRHMKEIFVRDLKVPASKIELIHHGFDLDEWRGSAAAMSDFRRELGIENKIVFGAVGRLFWVKDFERLIDAFAAATVDRDDVVLVIVGGGDQAELKEKLAPAGLEGKVILAGRREDIATVMNQFDVFVHSALGESFGMVLIEAMALGKPVVSTNVGIAREVVKEGETGFLAEPGDTSSLTAAIKRMLAERPNWPKWSENAKVAANEFSIQETQASCDEFYVECLRKEL